MIYSRHNKSFKESKTPKQEQQLELPLEEPNERRTKGVAKIKDPARPRKAKSKDKNESSNECESRVILPDTLLHTTTETSSD